MIDTPGTKVALVRLKIQCSTRAKKFAIDFAIPIVGLSWLYILWHLLPVLVSLTA